jgi:squalene-hopene/tetraprenyl-beta-curcumene cyclase
MAAWRSHLDPLLEKSLYQPDAQAKEQDTASSKYPPDAQAKVATSPPRQACNSRFAARIAAAESRGFAYLARNQRPDGSWLPLWFGNQHAPDDENPTYGTARVLAAYRDLDRMNDAIARRGVLWLLSIQNADGGWGGAANTPSSVEETALAVEALGGAGPEAESGMNKGLEWLVQQIEDGRLYNPTPIGFYFAKLWYFEKLYPIIFSVAALGRARRKIMPRPVNSSDRLP